mmetsp:Transcript_45551/g.85054  ORF Transcript_45551/g.85054 Transcript_45551/m.85054 type:complete len:581 (+) Transcript_45551:116-1858(+)
MYAGDMALGLATGTPPVLCGYLRVPLLVTMSARMRKDLYVLCGILPEVASILGILVGYIVFCSWLMKVLFADTAEGDYAFYDYAESINSLVILLTTANNPGVWRPSYDRNRYTALIFILYLAVGIFLLLNLFLATVYNSYKNSVASSIEQEQEVQTASLMRAYLLLSRREQPGLSKPQMFRLFECMNRYSKMRIRGFETVFSQLDEDDDGLVCESEFQELCNLLQRSFPAHHQDGTKRWMYPLTQLFPSRRWPEGSVRRLQMYIQSQEFNHLVNAMLVFNLGVIVMESHLAIFPAWANAQQSLQITEIVLGFMYAVEGLLKVWAHGFEEYWSHLHNQYDFVITWIVVLIQLSILAPGFNVMPTYIIRYVQLFRMLRLVRLLEHWPQYRAILRTAYVVIPSLARLIMVLFLQLSVFSYMGVQLFGGLVHSRGNNPKLEDTPYEANQYEAFNFNDFAGGMVLLFNILILNDWYTFMDCYVVLSGTRWARVYFFAFWLVVVLYMLNLVVAFILEAFVAQMSLVEEQERSRTVLGGLSSHRDPTSQPSIVRPTTREDASHASNESFAPSSVAKDSMTMFPHAPT